VKPYYEDESSTIYCGDALELLPMLPLRVDAVITDPPYCSGASEAVRRGKTASTTPESVTARPVIEMDSMGSLGFDWVTRRWLLAARRLTKPGGHLLCFTDWRMLPPLATLIETAGWRWNNVVVWDKAYPGLGNGFRAQHELVLVASNGAPEWHSYDFGNVLRSSRLTKTDHPHQKPLDLLGRMVATCTAANAVILDPFMGSGTTLEAARLHGRRAVGIEIEARHCAVAASRLSQRVLPLFEEAVG
jgi:site-specific DNA-methyltransferase (adenine-specific)